VVYEDTMLHAVVNRTPQEAAKSLIAVAKGFLALPGMVNRTIGTKHIHVGLEES